MPWGHRHRVKCHVDAVTVMLGEETPMDGCFCNAGMAGSLLESMGLPDDGDGAERLTAMVRACGVRMGPRCMDVGQSSTGQGVQLAESAGSVTGGGGMVMEGKLRAWVPELRRMDAE
ncbi:unnamed protein product [Pedinophyceae sp. YPF-701]|nr:unnamed protein product [Pedinophyceae sp. YPF-701]